MREGEGFCENRTRDTPLRGVYIPHFDQISVKISVFGSYTPIVAPIGVKFGMEEETFGPLLHWYGEGEGPLLHAKFHPIIETCRPCGAINLKIGHYE